MRQKFTLLTKTLLLLCALMAGSGSVWAEEITVLSENFNTNNTVTLLGNAGWTLTGNCSINSKRLQIASGSGAGSAKTPAFSSLVGTTATLTFSHVSSGSASRTLTVTGNNCKVDGADSKTISVSTTTGSATISITNASTTSSITFSAAKNQGTIIDDVVVTYTKASDSPLASIALSGTYPTTFTVGDEFSHTGMTVTATYENNSTSDVTSKASFSGYDMSIAGSQTVTVSYTEGAVTKTASYSIKVKGTADLAFTPSSVIVGTGSEESVSFTKSTDASITFVVIDPTIATYNAATGKIEGLKEGTTTLKATAEATEDYAAGEATCTIKVIDPDWIDFTAQGYENAEDVSSVTGLYGTVTFGKGTNTQNSPKWYDSGSAVRIYQNNTIKITAKTGYVLAAVEFSVTSGSMSASSFDKTVAKGSGNDFTLETPAAEITYTPSATVRIDKVKIILATLTKNVTSAGWATYAPEYPVEFATGEAYIINSASTSGTTLTEVSSVPAGTPVVLKGAGDHKMNVVASSSTVVSGNCLKVSDGVSTLNGVYVLADGKYGVGFYVWKNSTLSKGKIYLEIPSASREFISLDSEVSGIDATLVNGEEKIVNNEIYNLNGQRVSSPKKGLYIVNGKKLMRN